MEITSSIQLNPVQSPTNGNARRPVRTRSEVRTAPVKLMQNRRESRAAQEVSRVQNRREPAPISIGSRSIRLRVDEGTQRIVAQILDANREVIRQIPPQELLDISRRFAELRGLLFDESI